MIDNNFTDRRQSERVTTEIQGKINKESCLINNLSDGGVMLLSTFHGEMGQEVTIQFTYNQKFFEKKGVIIATNPVSRIRTAYKSTYMYGISVSFNEPVTKNDFFALDY